MNQQFFNISKFQNDKSPITVGKWDWPSTKLNELCFMSSLLVFCCLENQAAALKEPASLMTQLIKQCVATKMMFIQEHPRGSCYWSQQAVGKRLFLLGVSGHGARAIFAFLSQWLISSNALSKKNSGRTSEKCNGDRCRCRWSAGARSDILPPLIRSCLQLELVPTCSPRAGR